jgi:hypothetical protein
MGVFILNLIDFDATLDRQMGHKLLVKHENPPAQNDEPCRNRPSWSPYG